MTANGELLDPPLTLPKGASAADATVAADGTVTVKGTKLGQLQIVDVPAPAGLQPVGDSLYAAAWNHDWTRVGYQNLAPCHVFRFDGADRWIDCGQPGNSKRIFSMASYAGQLFAFGDDYTVPEGMARPYWSGNPATLSAPSAYPKDQTKPMNPTTFQILCAGQDGDFGVYDGINRTPADPTVKLFPSGLNYIQADKDNITNFSGGRTLGDSIP